MKILTTEGRVGRVGSRHQVLARRKTCAFALNFPQAAVVISAISIRSKNTYK
jgi:hypothetical protein